MSNTDNMFDKRSQRFHGLYQGQVADNSDFQRMGRLQVWIPELCSADETIVAMYAPPFGGATNPNNTDPDSLQTFDDTQRSYGFWAVPPDINNTVLIMFIDGHISKAVWISVLYQQYMNHMIPNIPVGPTFQEESAGDGVTRPSAEYNRNTPNASDAVQREKPYHKPHYEAIRNQGLKDDVVRGYSQNGARSERTSKVTGMLSPGGHYWSLEDTVDDEKVRLRTRSGVQVLLDDTRGHVYVINKSGKGWIEIDDNGKIMIYGEQGIALRSKGDINLRADNDLIMESGRDTYIRSEQNTYVENESFYQKSKDEYILNVENGKIEKLGHQHVEIKNDYQISSGAYKLGASGVDINSGSDFNATASSNVNINASANAAITGGANLELSGAGMVNMSGGGGLNMNAPSILQNVGGSAQSASPASPASPSIVTLPDLPLFDKEDVEQPKSDADPVITTVKTIVTTFPTHEPCPEHDIDPEER